MMKPEDTPQFIIVLSTVIRSNADLIQVKTIIASYKCISRWSHDLEDVDQVLRILADDNISEEVITDLKTSGIAAAIMEVFIPNCRQ